MSDTFEKLKADLESIKQHLQEERDELKLQLHLATEEAKDEWEDIEEQWYKFSGKVSEVAKESSHQLGEATQEIADDLKARYQKFRASFKKD